MRFLVAMDARAVAVRGDAAEILGDWGTARIEAPGVRRLLGDRDALAERVPADLLRAPSPFVEPTSSRQGGTPSYQPLVLFAAHAAGAIPAGGSLVVSDRNAAWFVPAEQASAFLAWRVFHADIREFFQRAVGAEVYVPLSDAPTRVAAAGRSGRGLRRSMRPGATPWRQMPVGRRTAWPATITSGPGWSAAARAPWPAFGLVRDVASASWQGLGHWAKTSAASLWQDGPNGGGHDWSDQATAMRKATVEAIERSVSAYLPGERRTYSDTEPTDIGLAEVLSGTRFQRRLSAFPVLPVREMVPEGEALRVQPDERWLPAELVRYPIPGRSPCLSSNSSGVAAGPSYGAAVMSAIYELSERDSVMAAWLHRLSPPQIAVGPDDGRAGAAAAAIRKAMPGAALTISDISFGKPFPHVLALLRSDNGKRTTLSVGASAAGTWQEAVSKALSEVASKLISSRGQTPTSTPARKAVVTVADHLRYFCRPDRADALAFLEAGRQVSFGTLRDPAPATPGSLAHTFTRAVGGRLYLADLTTTGTVAGYGVRVVRVLSEGAIPVWFGKNAALPLKKARATDRSRFLPWAVVDATEPDFLHFFD